jgi:hypothetical protein
VVDSRMSISKLGRYMVGTVSIYTKSTCAQTMCTDHVCPYLSVNKIIKQRGMTKACEKEAIAQREIGEGMGMRTKGNLGPMGKGSCGCHSGVDKGYQ